MIFNLRILILLVSSLNVSIAMFVRPNITNACDPKLPNQPGKWVCNDDFYPDILLQCTPCSGVRSVNDFDGLRYNAKIAFCNSCNVVSITRNSMTEFCSSNRKTRYRCSNSNPSPSPGTNPSPVPGTNPSPDPGTPVPGTNLSPGSGTPVPGTNPSPGSGTPVPGTNPSPGSDTPVPGTDPSPGSGTPVPGTNPSPGPGTPGPTPPPTPTASLPGGSTDLGIPNGQECKVTSNAAVPDSPIYPHFSAWFTCPSSDAPIPKSIYPPIYWQPLLNNEVCSDTNCPPIRSRYSLDSAHTIITCSASGADGQTCQFFLNPISESLTSSNWKTPQRNLHNPNMATIQSCLTESNVKTMVSRYPDKRNCLSRDTSDFIYQGGIKIRFGGVTSNDDCATAAVEVQYIKGWNYYSDRRVCEVYLQTA